MTSLDALIQSFLGVVEHHPSFATLVASLVTFSEAIPVVGAAPGTAMVLGLGSSPLFCPERLLRFGVRTAPEAALALLSWPDHNEQRSALALYNVDWR
ncbi:hypothetical protein [Microvirga sp. M2]|uniref:hypothetical protein n=1 Tax=Microvirga sp. M2 TaxID=3073270 RepID=UPI0039C4DF7F